MFNTLKKIFNKQEEFVVNPIDNTTIGSAQPLKEKQYSFVLYFLDNPTSGISYVVKYYDFQGDFIRMTLVDGSTLVQSSKNLDRFTIKENADTQ